MKKYLLLVLMTVTVITSVAGNLNVGAAKADITPAVSLFPFNSPHESYPYVGVHDSLFIRAVVMDDENVRNIVIELDEASVPDAEEWIDDIAKAANTKKQNIIITVSHTHSTLHPDSHNPKLKKHVIFMKEQTLKAVQEAISHIQPAKVSFGRTKAYVNVNNGESSRSLGQYDNDTYSDKTFDIIRFNSFRNKPIALILNYSTHAEVMFRSLSNSKGYEISGDLPGRVAQILENREDGAPVVLTTPGAEGDQQPLFTSKQRTTRQGTVEHGAGGWNIVDILARRIVDAALEKMETMEDETDAKLYGNATTISVPGQSYNHNWQTGENHLEETSDVTIPIVRMQMGDIAIEAIGADLASRIGTNIRNAAALKNTMLITNIGGSVGYILEDSAYKNPGHGAFGSKVKPGYAEKAIIRGLKNLK
jgi:Neutral/alkaline non-lysosomal ceramidase.